MPISASYLFVLMAAGMLFLEPLPTPPPSLPSSDSKPADAKPDGPTLPLLLPDGPSLPSSPPDGKLGTLVEEPAPPPHDQSVGPVPIPTPQTFREEAAPMPQEQTPPARFSAPDAARDPPLPDVESLHRETESLRLEREAMLSEETALITATDYHAAKGTQVNLQKRIAELLVRVVGQTKKTNETASAAPPPTSTASVNELGNAPKVLTDAPVDPLAMAQSLFRAGDYAAALDAYRKLDKDDPKPEERVAIHYMMACCLRKLGKVEEASALYREVANTPGNDFLAEDARWYLRTINERRELEAQLEELRQRRQAMKSRQL